MTIKGVKKKQIPDIKVVYTRPSHPDHVSFFCGCLWCVLVSSGLVQVVYRQVGRVT